MLKSLLEEKNLSIYKCSQLSGIPYTTLSEAVRGKTSIAKCSAEMVYHLSQLLEIPIEELIKNSMEPRMDFEAFKSTICHEVKVKDDLNFIISILSDDKIRYYWSKRWYLEAFYLLAMVDYLSRLNEIPLCTKYDDIRSKSLKKPLYPRDVRLSMRLNADKKIQHQCMVQAIPEFLRFNIIECEVRDVY